MAIGSATQGSSGPCVIDRFSEDIDLSISPAFVGADEAAFEAMKSRTRRDATLAQMQAQCGERTKALLMPRLERTIVEHLGTRAGFDYLRREVKLELGSLTDQRPTEQHTVRAWVVDGTASASRASASFTIGRRRTPSRLRRRTPACARGRRSRHGLGIHPRRLPVGFREREVMGADQAAAIGATQRDFQAAV